nr:hypothetical protein [Conexibacter sp. W3-3-2]
MTTATYTSDHPNHPLHRLTPEQIEEIGDAFQAIHDEVKADLGERDAQYIRNLILFHRRLAALSRIVLMASRYPRRGCSAPRDSASRRSSRTWRSGTTSCTASGTG